MEDQWTHNFLLVENIADDVSEKDLREFFDKYQPTEKVIFITDSFIQENYFIHQAIIQFKQRILSNQLVDRSFIDYKDTQFQIFFDLEERINFEFFIYGLDKNTSVKTLYNIYTPFRVEKIDLFPSKEGKSLCARVLFSRARDRDAAMMRAEHISYCGYYFFPDKIHTMEYQSQKLKSLKFEDESDPTTKIIYGEREFKVNTKRITAVSYAQIPEEIKLDACGDISILISYLNGSKITLNQNNIWFIKQMGMYLQNDELSKLETSQFLNLDNVIFMANQDQRKSEYRSFIDLVAPSYKVLTHNGRFRYFPSDLSAEIIKSIPSPGLTQKQILKILLQNTDPSDDKTPLVQLLNFAELSINDVKFIIQDPKIKIDQFKDAILSLTRKKIDIQQYLTIQYDSASPLSGIFAYLSKRDKAAFHKNVQTEASSTLRGPVIDIIQGKVANYFATKSMPCQWIKFTLVKDEIQLTNYVIQTHSDKTRPYIKNWDLSGSKDGINWVTIDSVTNCPALAKPSSIIMRPVKCNEFYRAFKLDHTGTNSLGYDNIALSHIELYGSIRNYEPDTQ